MKGLSMRVIITGGTGLIGRELSQLISADGHDVIVFSRNPGKAVGMPTVVRVEEWNTENIDNWGALVDGADAIINLAGAGIADGRWSRERKQLISDSRLDAGNILVEAIQAAEKKPTTFIQASAVGYYGTTNNDHELTEESLSGNDFLAKVCFDWELSTAPIERMGIRRVLLRTGIVLSNEGGAFPRMVLPFKMYAGGPLGDGEQWLPWIHHEDQAAAIYFLLKNEEANGPFNLSAPEPLINREFSQAIGRAMGRPSFMPAPAIALKLALGEMSTLVLDGQRAVPSKLIELGYTFKYPTAEVALTELLDQTE